MGIEPVRTLSESDVSGLLGELFADRAVASLASRTGGGVTSVYEAVFADGADPLILKAYAELSRPNRAKEVHVYGLLADHRVGPIPTIVHSAESSPHLHGRAHTVMTRLPGEPVQSVVGAMTEAERFDVYRQMGVLIAAVHRIGMPAFGYVTTAVRDPVAANGERMARLWGAKLAEFDGFGGDPGLGAAIRRYAAERAEVFALCRRPVLCHNDFHEGNVLFTPPTPGSGAGARQPAGWRLTGLIDVENAVAGDPFLDLAKTDWCSVRGDRAKWDGLVEGYGGEAALGPSWPERLEAYRLLHMLELWNWFSEIGQREYLASIAGDMRAVLGTR